MVLDGAGKVYGEWRSCNFFTVVDTMQALRDNGVGFNMQLRISANGSHHDLMRLRHSVLNNGLLKNIF